MRRTAPLALLVLLAAAGLSAAPSLAALELRGVYFTETGCSHCDAFLYAGKARLEQERSVTIALETHDILSDSGYALCVKMLAERGLPFTSFPVLFIEGAVYRGSTAIEQNLGRDIEAFKKDGVWPAATTSTKNEPTGAAFVAAAIPVLLAGLLDGINPCAFSTLLFFLSFVSLRKKRREAVLFTGLAFISGVFVAYFLIGFGLLASLRAALSAGRFSIYLNSAVTAAAVVLVVLNLRDARRAYLGEVEESTLKLPKPLRDASHSVIRRFSSGPAGIVAAALAGAAVSLIELACTGQIYLPTIAYLNRTAFTSHSLALLLAYNLAFVLPLVLVFALFYFGLTHQRIQDWYRRRIVLVRLLSAAFFLAMGGLVWI
jgi:cytochrome c biogenesis protein CcdA/glutaredoxin